MLVQRCQDHDCRSRKHKDTECYSLGLTLVSFVFKKVAVKVIPDKLCFAMRIVSYIKF